MEYSDILIKLKLLIEGYLDEAVQSEMIGFETKIQERLDSFASLSFLMEVESTFSVSLPKEVFYEEERQTLSWLAEYLHASLDGG